MPLYSRVSSGQVIGTVFLHGAEAFSAALADATAKGQLLILGGYPIGSTYDEGTGNVILAPEDFGRSVSVEALQNRFTEDEMAELDVRAQHNPAGAPGAQRTSAKLRRKLHLLEARKRVNLDDPQVRSRVLDMCQVLVSAGLIADANARATEILDTPVTSDEV